MASGGGRRETRKAELMPLSGIRYLVSTQEAPGRAFRPDATGARLKANRTSGGARRPAQAPRRPLQPRPPSRYPNAVVPNVRSEPMLHSVLFVATIPERDDQNRWQ